MIIVSQDRNSIVNFDRAEIIHINNNKKTQIGAWFSCDENIQDNIILGEYKTEERAKEVLEEIIKAYTCWENFKYGIAEGIGTPKYETPQE